MTTTNYRRPETGRPAGAEDGRPALGLPLTGRLDPEDGRPLTLWPTAITPPTDIRPAANAAGNEPATPNGALELCPVCNGPANNDEWSSSWCPSCELAFYRWTADDEAMRLRSST